MISSDDDFTTRLETGASRASRGRAGEEAPTVSATRVEVEASGGASRRWYALAVLCVSLLIVTLDNTVLNVALPTLVDKLNASSTRSAVDRRRLRARVRRAAARVRQPRRPLRPQAHLSRRAWSPSPRARPGPRTRARSESLIAARASMGLGAALIMPSTLAIIAHTFTRGARAPAGDRASGRRRAAPASRSARSWAGCSSSTSGGAPCS